LDNYIAAMTGFVIVLLTLTALGGLAGCGFGLLWLRLRDATAEERRDLAQLRIEHSELQAKAANSSGQLAKAVEAFNALRAQAKEKLARSAREIDHWRARYERLARWEGVEDASAEAAKIQARVTELERTAEALQNAIEGYGSKYVLPPQSVLDDLVREAGHKESGQRLKAARDQSRQMVRKGQAISCDEQDPERRGLVEGFVLDAFNGKIEGIMEGVKHDNIGTLIQQVNDAFLLVNRQSRIFSNARILKPYLKARLDELRWASLVQQYKKEEREEQRRIKEKMREDAKIAREVERERREAEQAAKEAEERRAEIERARSEGSARARLEYEKRLAEELARASESERAAVEARMRSEHEQNLELQRAEYEQRIAEQDERLQQALARGQRAISMAEQVKRGHVYIISNEGSFGEGVYKIGQTRRGAVDDSKKQERIDELGDASVPFEFDVHAWLPSENAPELEQQLQRRFVLNQVNKMNWRKEFFRVTLAEIRRAVEDMGIKVEWTMAAEAREYRETLKLEEQMAADASLRDRWVQEQLGVEHDGERDSEMALQEDSGAE